MDVPSQLEPGAPGAPEAQIKQPSSILLGRLFTGMGLLAGLILVFIAIGISIDVIARNFGFFTWPWMLELSEYGLYAATMLAAPWVLHLHGHIRVDILINSMPPPIARALEMFCDCIGLIISLILVVYSARITAIAYIDGTARRAELTTPESLLYGLLFICAMMLALEFIMRFYRVARG